MHFQLGAVPGAWFRRRALQQLDSVAYTCTSALSSGFPLLQGNGEAVDR